MSKPFNSSGRPYIIDVNGEISLHFSPKMIQSTMLKSDPGALFLEYTRTMMGFLFFHPRPKRILMIGLGGGSLAKYCRRKLPKSDITVVELSPEVIALRDDFGIPEESPLFHIVQCDGADFVRNACSGEGFDVLLVDGFNQNGQPAQLCSEVFYDNCYGCLRDGGLMVANLCVSDSRHLRSIGLVQKSFHGKTLVVDAEQRANEVIFASKSAQFPLEGNVLIERLRRLEPAHSIELDRTALKIMASGSPRRKK